MDGIILGSPNKLYKGAVASGLFAKSLNKGLKLNRRTTLYPKTLLSFYTNVGVNLIGSMPGTTDLLIHIEKTGV